MILIYNRAAVKNETVMYAFIYKTDSCTSRVSVFRETFKKSAF